MAGRFSASYAERYMSCHAAANLELAIPGFVEPPRPPGGAADLGTSIHEILEGAAGLTLGQLSGLIKALQFLEDLKSQRRYKVLAEVGTTADWLPSKPPTKVDLVLYLVDELHVIDWKTGKIVVWATDNKQLKYYAACFLHLAPKAKGVWIHVVQPWADGHIDSEWVSRQELEDFMAEAVAADIAITAGDITFGPTDKGCEFCPANPHSRGNKGSPSCPVMLDILYPPVKDVDDLLDYA
jgi:hypothetical protein